MSPSNEEHRRDDVLRVRFARHRSLVSAWEVIAASHLPGEKCDALEAARELGEDLLELASRDPAGSDSSAVSELDSRLGELEALMRASALRIPVHQLRSMLPRHAQDDRQGLLDLLDLLLGAEVEALAGVEARIPALDYLITLLCIGDSGRDAVVLYDPVSLTRRLAALCEGSDLDVDRELSEVEAEFFAAADLYEAAAGQSVAKRSLRRRKAALGRAYFIPRVLRAIVTYNAARLRGIGEELVESRDPRATVLEQELHADVADEPGEEARVLPEPPTPAAFAMPSEDVLRRHAAAEAREVSSQADDFGSTADQLAREALAAGLGNGGRAAKKSWEAPPAGRVAWGLGVLLAVVLAVLAFPGLFSGSDLTGYSRAELDVLSPHLSSGSRNLDGSGPAFVGALYEDFFTRSVADQTRIAEDLVAALRTTGVSQIMIYDGERRLRVQALGRQTVRVLSAEGG